MLLFVTGLWAVWNDNISRRPWKLFQHEFRNLEYRRAEEALTAEQKRLEADPQYQELQQQLATARKNLTEGEVARQIASRQGEIDLVGRRLAVVDLDLRLVKSELEEAWYELDHAKELGHAIEGPRARIDKLEEHRVATKKEFDDLSHKRDQLESEIKELQVGVKTIEDKIADYSVFSRARRERFRESEVFRCVSERVVAPCNCRRFGRRRGRSTPS